MDCKIHLNLTGTKNVLMNKSILGLMEEKWSLNITTKINDRAFWYNFVILLAINVFQIKVNAETKIKRLDSSHMWMPITLKMNLAF